MVLITGASRGLGRELFSTYLKNGTPVFGTYHSSPPNDAPQGSNFKVDVSDFKSVEDWIQQVTQQNPTLLDQGLTLINCAGISSNSFLHKSDPEKWEQVIKVNLLGTYNCIRAILPLMREKNHGRIITVSSVVAQQGVAGTSSYAASKAGLWGLVKSLSKEVKGKNITVNNINLGYFDVGMIEQVPQALQEDVKSKIPRERFGKATELFSLVEYLRGAEYVNGSSFDINGGLF
jgi:acetoacetyl-CoA reductase/3-oxoacyl-[acyl-carrier protein] reductase